MVNLPALNGITVYSYITLEVKLRLFISMRWDVPVRRISRPSTMIASGASAPRAPVTRISKCTVSPSAASELFKTAVTLGESACANCALAITPRTANNLRQCMRICIDYQLSTINPPGPLPVLIDMARCSAFIKLNPRLLVFHGFQKRLGLAFAHLALLLGFGFGNLRVLIRRPL